MDMDLGGRTAVVTGASKGIGPAVTRSLTDTGAHVVAGPRTRSAKLVDARRVTFVPGDLSEASRAGSPGRGRGGTRRRRHPGQQRRRGAPRARIPRNHRRRLERLVTLGLTAAVRTTRGAVPSMVERGSGVIVMTASVNAFLPDTVMDYSGGKDALTNFAKSLSKELGPQGIRGQPGPGRPDLCLAESGVAEALAYAAGKRPRTSWPPPSRPRRSGGSPSRRKSPTWSPSRQAAAPPISPAWTSPSTAA